MAIDYTGFAIPKPPPRERKTPTRIRVKAKPKDERDRIALVRDFVFARERGTCRICRCRPATEMHELRPRSLRGRVSKTNSIAVDDVCHRLIQHHEISYDADRVRVAEGTLYFMPRTEAARTWMKLGERHGLESPPMREMESE